MSSCQTQYSTGLTTVSLRTDLLKLMHIDWHDQRLQLACVCVMCVMCDISAHREYINANLCVIEVHEEHCYICVCCEETEYDEDRQEVMR